MTKIKERRNAILLRKKGKSFSEIRKIVKVSKSSLSIWLKQYKLTKKQIVRIDKIKYRAIEKFRLTMQKKREDRLKRFYCEQRKILLPFSKKELLIAGLLLYWGEGNKASAHSISINNTDPGVLKFALFWLIKSLSIPKNKIKVYLHLYKDMNIQEETNFWSKVLDINKEFFSKPYIKETLRKNIDQKGFGHGTCTIVVHNTRIKEKIQMAIKSIADYYGRKISVV